MQGGIYMKGLRLYLPPFAPDQSGAVSVLYRLGGLIVICDAGGCTGNICGFDEPRWFQEKSAVFSAGLRDMDAILGRDDRLVSKLCSAARQIKSSFAAIIGTPVPAVIGTDYHALKRMTENKLSMPVLTIDTNGTRLYDEGAAKAFLALFAALPDDFRAIVLSACWAIAGVISSDLTAPGIEANRYLIASFFSETVLWAKRSWAITVYAFITSRKKAEGVIELWSAQTSASWDASHFFASCFVVNTFVLT